MEQRDNRIKKNVLSGFLYQIILIALGFLLPRLYLENFGSEVNGVLSTIKQIFTYMCLLEAGVGLASTQALYKPMAEKDYKGASSILAATSKYYFKTGIVYTVLVLVLASVYAFVIPSGIDSMVLFTIVILTALPALFSYFIQAKYRVLMEVDGRKYVINNSEIFLQIISNVAKILVLLLTDSLVLIQLSYCIIALVQLSYIVFYAKKRYKWLNLKEEPNYKAIAQKNSVLVHQVSGLVFNNTDVLLLSAMCDFKVVSIYTIYNMFFAQMQAFITSIVSGFSFALGQMFQVDRDKFNRVYSAYETVYIMATFIIYTLMAVFLLPLIQIYTTGINDANYTNSLLLFLFVIMNLLSNGKLPSNYVLEFSGKFKETRSHAIIEMTINIVVSVLAILKWGICGAIFGTIVALLFRGPMMIYYANKKVLGKSVFATYKLWLINGGVFAIVMLILSVDSFSGLTFVELLLKGVIHSAWIIALYALANFVFQGKTIRAILELKGDK